MRAKRFPFACPACGGPTVVRAHRHCYPTSCPWLKCDCGAVFDKAGNYFYQLH